jgi:Integrase zinc binding domain
MNNALWIPEHAVELKLRLCVEAHCRSAGLRAYEETLGAIKGYVAWTTMAKDVKVFVQNCLHCIATIPGDKCHDRWVRRYMQPSPTISYISTSSTLGCQETGSISTCSFSRLI